MIISYMQYHGGHKKVMLGTSLWEQSLNNPANINSQTFALTLFPVSYDSKRESPYKEFFQGELNKQQSIGTNWIALGFDFVLMSSQLQIQKKRTKPRGKPKTFRTESRLYRRAVRLFRARQTFQRTHNQPARPKRTHPFQ